MSEADTDAGQPPRLLRLANALAGALEPDVSEWTTDRPWTDGEATAEEFVAHLVLVACAGAEEILGRAGLMPEHDEEVLTRQLLAHAIAFGCDLDSFNEAELRKRIRVALEVVREETSA